ncbi:MAG: hypothetical protein MO853_11240 [Candidatus Protistobacter heckmanni]|nr:hypothetical protein [Candidatus Protistobacter heckmanni]
MLASLSFKARLRSGFGIFLAMIAAVGAVSAIYLGSIAEHTRSMGQYVTKAILAEEIKAGVHAINELLYV